ncbi:ATP-binding cassette subfamily B protein/ATP-binding cassette subfamily C protein [Catenuloplanes nepalensis]|uniref:ATP-binding cassette subfamily B protein/ATP-binding cassette subfamily C protein n=1 Tax=Catenuloplanes nepalensis TaxID=587533 RepID=A0ABT9MWF2_9ACTN|nr:ABC transporter ATP-binding protein [Catenuloplanes nepalensis]MDP9795774.1 ATP-binding cassette subfamily B protein/ATP-binding cassette subfamily C protein [Catenuloplanes nepalensis]
MTGETTPPVGLRALAPHLRSHWPTLALVAVLSMLGAAASLVQPLLTRDLLDAIGASESVGGLVALLAVLVLAAAGINAVRDFLLQRTAEGVVLGTRRRLAHHLLRLPIAEYDARRTGDLLSRVGADTTLLRAVVTSGLFDIAAGAVMVVGAIGAMALLDPLLLGVTLLALTLGMGIAITASRRVRALSRATQARIGEMTSTVERAISAARTIRAARAEGREADLVVASAEGAYAAGLRVARLQALISPVATTATQGAFLAVLGVGGARVAAGDITVGDLVAFILFLFFLVMPLGQAIGAYTQLQTGLGALERIEEVLRIPAEEHGAGRAEAAAGRNDPVSGRTAVEFEGVGFAYPAADGPVLGDVSFTVPYGTRTALVGPSGAGKSTLLALVERFYETTAGTIRVDGRDVREQSRDALRSRLGYVEQEAPVLAGTIRENLLLAAPETDDARLLAVLESVNLTGIVTRAGAGLDAQVGEGGVLLSGGERQRLAIARALLTDAPILLMDEPTSNLDARNEAALRRAIDAAAETRTLLVVAHRLSTVVESDQIVVMESGRVVATGRHEELVDSSPLYRELAAHQLLVPEAEPSVGSGVGGRGGSGADLADAPHHSAP